MGNSASVRIPAGVMAATNIKIDEPVFVRVEAGHIVFEPLATPFDLVTLINAIADENRHGETDMGRSRAGRTPARGRA